MVFILVPDLNHHLPPKLSHLYIFDIHFDHQLLIEIHFSFLHLHFDFFNQLISCLFLIIISKGYVINYLFYTFYYHSCFLVIQRNHFLVLLGMFEFQNSIYKMISDYYRATVYSNNFHLFNHLRVNCNLCFILGLEIRIIIIHIDLVVLNLLKEKDCYTNLNLILTSVDKVSFN